MNYTGNRELLEYNLEYEKIEVLRDEAMNRDYLRVSFLYPILII